MQNVTEARRFTINALDKAYTDTRYLVDALVKDPKADDSIKRVQLKLDNLELYINTLKTLDRAQLTGGRKTRKNRRKSKTQAHFK
jgi:hypothetical protein